MTMPGCFSAFGVCAIRASELAADGSRICPNVDGSAFDLSPITFTATAEVTEGERFEQRDGCGNVCTVVTTPDETTGYSGSLELCNQNFELILTLTNGSTESIVNGSGLVIGYKQISGNPDPVEFNIWQRVQSGNSAATGANAHLRSVFPYTQWNMADMTFEAGVNTVSLNFTSQGNAGIGLGSFLDFADTLSGALYARWLEAEIPDMDDEPYASTIGCGWISTPACAS